MIPLAARAVIAAQLTDELDVPPHLATVFVASLADRLAVEGWHMTDGLGRVRDAGIHLHHEHHRARPVAPRARETPRARRSLPWLLRRAGSNGGNTP
ncbi:hypothetical protein AB0F25_34310 [Streptomyces wedmorensis]|uniref:hypothetical protein n=1 Tax=Streptomyces wedmorensis TaxID=43759 RepID=UPI00341AA421